MGSFIVPFIWYAILIFVHSSSTDLLEQPRDEIERETASYQVPCFISLFFLPFPYMLMLSR